MAAVHDFSGARPTPRWKQKLAGFWRWWTGELGAMMPDRFARGSRVPMLALESGEVVVVEPKSAAGPAARVALESLDATQARAGVRALLERVGETRGRARVRLSRDEALVRRVSMPAATEENLAQVVGFEMDRLTPFRADEVYYDQHVVSRDPAAGLIAIQLAVARRDLVDARVARMRDLGVSVQGVAVGEESAGRGPSLDLMPTEQRGQAEAPRERILKRVLLATVFVLLLVALLLPSWQKRESVIAAYPLLTKARQDAEGTEAIARDLERQVADYNFLLAKKHAPSALAYLEDVSRLLPDNTWVQQFELRTAGKSREVQITGETTSSSKLIEILEQSTLLQNATPRGSVTRGSQPGTERFMIAAETRPKAAPAMLPAAEVAVVPTAPSLVVAAPAGTPPAEGVDLAARADAPRGDGPADQAAAAGAEAAAQGGQPPVAAAPATAKVEPVPRPPRAPSSSGRQMNPEEREARLRELKARRDAQQLRGQQRARERATPSAPSK